MSVPPAASPQPTFGPPGQPPAGPPAPTGGGSRRWLLVVVLGVVMLLLAATGAYLGVRGYRGTQLSQSCDSYQCIPRLEATTVVDALKEQGYTCTKDYNHSTCDLRVGFTHFEAVLQVADEHIHAIDLKIFRSGSDPLAETGLAFLNWFATLPYARDEETSAKIRQWVAEQVEGNKDAQATIGDYRYTLINPDPKIVRFEIRGNF